MKFTSRETRLVSNQKTMSVELGLADQKKAIELLYSQYSKPIQTCVQELVSNAFDAMQDSGRGDRPIKVQLPNELNDYYFSVRDYGNSMDEDAIKNVYMRVNASTKSNNNKAIGGFGIGSKTPWAYTDTFILKTFLNGLETQYALVKGRSSVNIVYTGSTTQENGTEVVFKTKPNDTKAFEKAVKRISLCAKTKPIVNGNLRLDFDDEVKINSLVSFVKSELLDTHSIYLNIGGVLYRFNESIFGSNHGYRTKYVYKELRNFTNNSTIVVHLPVGSVMPLQTREGLFTGGIEGQQNKVMLKRIFTHVLGCINNYIVEQEKTVKCASGAIAYFGNGMISSQKVFDYPHVRVSSKELTLPQDNYVSVVSRKGSRRGWGASTLKRGKKNTRKWLYLKDLKQDFYFSELPANKARLVTRFHDLSQHGEVIILEKDSFENQDTYEFLKNYTNAKNIETVDVPKKVSTNLGRSVDKTRVVIHTCENEFEYNYGEYFTTDNRTKKTVLVEKGSYLKYNKRLYTLLGYSIWWVAGKNIKKLVELNPSVFFTVDEALEDHWEDIARMYVSYKVNDVIRSTNITRNNTKFILRYVSEKKRQLAVLPAVNYSFTYQDALISEVKKRYGSMIDKMVKRMVKNKLRVVNIVDKVPLVEHIERPEWLTGQAKEDIDSYIKERINA